LRNAAGKTHDELEALKSAIKATELNAIEKKTNNELAIMKSELENLKREMKGRKLLATTQKDLTDLRTNLSNEMPECSDAFTRDEVHEMKEKSAQLEAQLLQCASGDEKVISVKREIETMKDNFKKKEVSSKILAEVAALKTGVEEELKKSEGVTQQELVQLKKQIQNLTEAEINSKDLEELDALKDEVGTLRTGLKALEMATETKKELQLLKKSLAQEIKENSGKTEETLTMMKKAIDAVGMEQKEGKSLKKSLADEIKSANEKTERELLQFKKALDALDVKKLESKSQDEWQTIRQDMEKMKAELEDKQAGKTSLDEELANIKRSIEAINLDKIRSNNDHEFGELRQELNNMRSNLKQQDEKEASLKSEIEKLKMKDATLVEKKKGLKKFFSRHFSKKAGGGSSSSNDGLNGGSPMTYSVANTITGKEDQAVTTIAPPSVIGGMRADVLPDSDEDTYNTLSINEEIMAKLSQSFDNVVVETTATTVEEQPSSVEVETVMSSQSPASTSVAVAAAS
jgi:myosin heavy subunit